jgi:hypothetical protein
MAKNPGGRNIVSAVKETLDSVVTPSVRDTILARALAAVKRTELPTEPRAFEEFLQGPLSDALVKALGPELGLSVSSELERIAALAGRETKPRSQPPARRVTPDTVRPGRDRSLPAGSPLGSVPAGSLPAGARKKLSRSTLPSPEIMPPGSTARTDERWVEQERRGIAPTLPAGRRGAAAPGGRRESTRPSKGAPVRASGAPFPVSNDYPRGVAQALGVFGTASVDPRPSSRPTVLLASSDPELFRLFQAWLDMRAQVETAIGVTALLGRLAEVGGPRSVIVLDGKNPSIRPLTLAALADELPAGTTVILWGVQTHLHARMCSISAAAEKWMVYAGDATSNEIVAQCAKIVG